MKYFKYTGAKLVNGIWQDIALEIGGWYFYGYFVEYKGPVIEDLKKSLFILPEDFQGSDYSGGLNSRSNLTAFMKQFKDTEGVYELFGDFNTYAIAIRSDVAEENEEIKRILEGLRYYPIIDEEAYSQLEHEWESIAMKDIVKDLCCHIDLEEYIPNYETYLEDTETIAQLAWDGINECNLEWVHEYTSAYLDYERVKPYVEDRLLIDHCDAIPLLVNREWSCNQTKEMYLAKFSN